MLYCCILKYGQVLLCYSGRMTRGTRPLIRTVERRNGKEVVVYKPNPRYPREKALKEFENMLRKVAMRLNREPS